MIQNKIEITVVGRTEKDCEGALDEAIRKIKAGYRSGADSNYSSRYYFTAIEHEVEE